MKTHQGEVVKFSELEEALRSASDNKQSDAIALVCEVGKLIDDKGDLPLWAYRNQARIRTVCIAQQHT